MLLSTAGARESSTSASLPTRKHAAQRDKARRRAVTDRLARSPRRDASNAQRLRDRKDGCRARDFAVALVGETDGQRADRDKIQSKGLPAMPREFQIIRTEIFVVAHRVRDDEHDGDRDAELHEDFRFGPAVGEQVIADALQAWRWRR